MTQLPHHVEYIPGYIQSFVNWAGYPPPRKRIACVMLEKALNAQLLRDMPPVLSGYNSARDTYHWSKMVLPTRPLPESIGYNIIAPRAVWNDDLARLQDTDRCCYFWVRYGEIYFQYVCQVMETTTNVAPIFPRARTEDEWPDDTTEDQANCYSYSRQRRCASPPDAGNHSRYEISACCKRLRILSSGSN